MSQEIRERWWRHEGRFVFIDTAKVKEIKSSHKTNKKRKDIVEMKNKLFKIYGA